LSPPPRHFRLEPVGDGAWAAIALPDRGAVGNAGIVDLGGEVLVFDAMLTPGAARELRVAAEELAGPVRWVANSHWHGDHVRGNAVFEGATILATAQTRELIAALGEERLRGMKATPDEQWDELEGELREQGKNEEAELLTEFRRELPSLEQRLPDETWEGRRALGRAELLTWGGGHTASDAVLWLPELRLVFTADLVVVDSHPWLGDGDPEGWLGILDRLDELGIERLVPGHGPVGSGAHVGFVRSYVETLLELPDALPPEYAELDFADVYERNLAFLRGRVQIRAD
jgi:cyclase